VWVLKGKRTDKLTDRTVKALPAGTWGDGAGLYLQVLPSGARTWLFRYKKAGKTTWMGLGGYPTVGLAEAREAAGQAKRTIKAGTDPLGARKAAKAEREALDSHTFAAVAGRYIAAHKAGWRNEKHVGQWLATLQTYAYPQIKDKAVSTVTVADVLAILEPIWTEKPETASRVRGRIEAVLDYATARKLRFGENPARWKGHLDHLLPARAKVAKVEHHAALPWLDAPALIAKLAESKGMAAACLRFLALTAARSGEARGAKWSEIDMAAKVWTIPAERMKAAREHRVPLTDTALAILRAAYPPGATEKPDSGLVFPGGKPGAPLSDVALAKALHTAGAGDFTVHGMRSTFRDWAAESTAFPREVCEAALAHGNKDKVEAAYLRGDHFEKRRKLMEAWATYATGPARVTGANVTAIKAIA
jgi:integrase